MCGAAKPSWHLCDRPVFAIEESWAWRLSVTLVTLKVTALKFQCHHPRSLHLPLSCTCEILPSVSAGLFSNPSTQTQQIISDHLSHCPFEHIRQPLDTKCPFRQKPPAWLVLLFTHKAWHGMHGSHPLLFH